MSAQTEEAAAQAAPRTGKGTAPPPASGRGAGARAVPYLLILPAAAVTVLLLGWTMVKNGLLSFQNLGRRQLIRHITEWTGIDNYGNALGSSEFWRVTGRSVLFTAANVTLIMVIGCLTGLLLARLGTKLRLLLSLGLVLAWVMPVVAATTVFQWLFDQRFGVVDYLLDRLGWHAMAHYNWTGSQFSTFFVITVLIVWQSVPFVAINLYAATTTIPKELYEAASLDGAGTWKQFTSVTFPFLRPFFLATTFLEVIWVFKSFTQVFAINEGGPDRLTETLPVYAFQEGMGSQHFGMGAAISILTIVILLALTAYYLRLVLKQEEDEL
ncbi:N,N'-diacetylchitobiose transport system permease protein [Streptomyces olivoverticillatus]|uniref:N,N'-diacetylchitobiose transport system permease protein n=1 Tax=Streptomyces olivoverticillatus TaxID=66427 RepID=A0A7W7PIR6_9ACTN|nr:sugar ABC transporter permease [Streptomyces olivoverticillatus]MBB4891377.1 N,N'-diacetylchitobiose transport system permease protein [Streptomyces olivoverticillatus]